MRGIDGVTETVTLAAIAEMFHAVVTCVDLASLRQHYDSYRQWEGDCSETERA